MEIKAVCSMKTLLKFIFLSLTNCCYILTYINTSLEYKTTVNFRPDKEQYKIEKYTSTHKHSVYSISIVTNSILKKYRISQ